MKQIIKIALLCLFPVFGIAQTPAYQKSPRSLRVTDNGQIYKWKDSIYYKNLIADSVAKLEAFINKKDFLSTGLIDHAALSATVGQTVFAISAGHGVVANFDNHFYPSIKRVNITAKTGITPQFLTTSITSYIAIDSNNNVVQSATPFTDIQSRDLIILGAIIHSNQTTITGVNNIAKPIIANTNQLHDLYEAVGALNTAGNKYTFNGANLNIDKSAGNLFKLGVNFVNNWKSPSKLTIGTQTALTFRYRTQTSAEGSDVTSISPGFYDVGGTVTAIPGANGRFTIQRITIFQSGLTRIQYGQAWYDNKAEAIAAIPTEPFITEANIAENGIFRAYLVVRKNATNLSDPAQAEFIEVSKFGSPIGSAGSAVTSANIIAALGYTPENIDNKQNSLSVDGSGVKYPTVDGVNTIGNSLIHATGNETKNGRLTLTTPTAAAGAAGISPLIVTGGKAGANTVTSGTVTSGTAANVNITGGAGGDITGITSGTALSGSGAKINLTGGDGGNTLGTSTSSIPGSGGDVIFQGGGSYGGLAGSAQLKAGNNYSIGGSGGDVWLVSGYGNSSSTSNPAYDGTIWLGRSPSGQIRGNVVIADTFDDRINKLQVTGNSKFTGKAYVTAAPTDPTGVVRKAELDLMIPLTEKGAANGVATLGADGKVPNSQIPALAISETFVVASQAAMLAISGADQGDVAVRTDISKSFILTQSPASTLGNWQELLAPTDAVQSVNGQVGNVNLTKSDIGLSNSDNTSDLNKPISTATQTALNLKADKTTTISAGTGLTGGGDLSANRTISANFGTGLGTIAQGNDSRINNGQTAFGWGNHAGLYPTYNGTGATGTWPIGITGNAATATNSTQWNGASNNFASPVGGGLDAITGTDVGGTHYRFTKAAAQSYLNINSGGETLPSVTARGNFTGANSIIITGETRPVGNPTGKSMILEQSATAGIINSYDFGANTPNPLTLNASSFNFTSGNATFSGNVTSAGKLTAGNGGFTSNTTQLFDTSSDGTFLGTKTGVVNDLTITTPAGSPVIVMPTGTSNIVFSGNVSSNPAPTIGDHLTNKTYVDAQLSAAGASGTYTPTWVADSNVSAITSTPICHFIRVGNEVTVTGGCFITTTAPTTQTIFTCSLPIASNLTAGDDLFGNFSYSVNSGSSVGTSGHIGGNSTTDVAVFSVIPSASGSLQKVSFSFMYTVK